MAKLGSAGRGVVVSVVNGRLSERSFRGYGHIGWLMRRTMEQVDWVGAQDSTMQNASAIWALKGTGSK